MTPDARERLRIIERARERIADPDHWCKYHAAVNQHNYPVEPMSPDARKWCAVAALMVGADGDMLAALNVAALFPMKVSRVAQSHSLVGFNNAYAHRHADILAVFDEMIATLGETRNSDY